MATIMNTYTNYINGTSDADLIYNYVPAVIHGHNGDDQIANVNGGQVAYLAGDNGNDAIINYAWNSQTYLNGGAGNDGLWNLGTGVSTLYGGYAGYDYYKDNDIMSGSPYAVDFFVVGEYCGYDLIQNYDSNDAIFCAISSGYPPYVYNYGNDVIIQDYFNTMSVTVQGAAYKQLNLGYMGGYNEPTYDTATDTANDNLWGGANVLYATDEADNIFISKNDGNDLIFNAAQDDTIHFYDATLSDIVSTAASDNAVAIAFNTGETAVIATEGNTSAKFKLASGESYVYNREAGAWQQA